MKRNKIKLKLYIRKECFKNICFKILFIFCFSYINCYSIISIVNNNAHERIVIYMVKHVNKEEFENLIKQEKIVVVDFFAVWCGPCQMLTPVLEDLSNELTEIDVLKIDIDEEQELAISMGIEVVPTVMVFKNGEKQKVLEGLRSKSEFIEEIEKLK